MTKILESLTLLLPCYNEEDNVEIAVKHALDVAQEITHDFELIIVNDGSTDRTAVMLENLVAENEFIRVIHHSNNEGYGAALKSGIRSSRKKWLFYTDCDNQFDIRELKSIITLVDRFDIVACYRKRRNDNFIRKLNSKVWTLLINYLFNLEIRDVNCAFKLFRHEIFNDIELISSGAFINAEILVQAKTRGYKIGQIGVNHYSRRFGKQTGGGIIVAYKAFSELLKLRKKLIDRNKQ
jgi:glycosyltransferase involved in cell wall biosynthesis